MLGAWQSVGSGVLGSILPRPEVKRPLYGVNPCDLQSPGERVLEKKL